ncbi:MAG: potassium-transporting ATPase subunit F [Bacteroidota bacterium]
MNTTILLVQPVITKAGPGYGYLAGAIIALAVFGYLIYTLVKPDKF